MRPRDSIGGGGWGPIVAGTLPFSEFFVTFASSATLLLTIGVSNWVPIAGLALGSAIAAPFAAWLTGRIPARPMMIVVGVVVILLSVRTLLR